MARRAANRPALPDRISLWLAANKRLVLGALIVAAAIMFVVWVTMPSLPFDAEREFSPGDNIRFSFQPGGMHFFDAESGVRLE